MGVHDELEREAGAPARRPPSPQAAGSHAAAGAPHADVSRAHRRDLTPHHVMHLQRAAGNRAVATVMRDEDESVGSATGQADAEPQTFTLTEQLDPEPENAQPDTAHEAAAPATGFSDGGMVGVAPFGERTGHEDLHVPHAFTDGGMTGTIAWAGGGGAGAHGNQGVGTLQTQVAPTFTGSPGPTAGRFSSRITPGTGLVAATRSFLGAFSGDQGNGTWMSVSATNRVNQHERNHVASTRGIYAANITPLETRIANAALGTDVGATAAEAVTAHQAAINWGPSIQAFRTADTAANTPGGTIDTADVAAGWIQNLGPGNVLGVAFTQRVVLAGEAAPPAAAPGPPAGP